MLIVNCVRLHRYAHISYIYCNSISVAAVSAATHFRINPSRSILFKCLERLAASRHFDSVNICFSIIIGRRIHKWRSRHFCIWFIGAWRLASQVCSAYISGPRAQCLWASSMYTPLQNKGLLSTGKLILGVAKGASLASVDYSVCRSLLTSLVAVKAGSPESGLTYIKWVGSKGYVDCTLLRHLR